VLAQCLAGGADLGDALRRYEQLRLPRASRIQRLSYDNNVVYHLADGPEQRARDDAMLRGEAFGPDTLTWLFQDDQINS
jgi:salicylate hydroxylase